MLILPLDDQNKTWANANLRDRAYFAAWFSNVYSMFYLNVTNPKNKQFPQRFQYVSSTVGKTFPLELADFTSFKPTYDQLIINGEYGAFLVCMLMSPSLRIVDPEALQSNSSALSFPLALPSIYARFSIHTLHRSRVKICQMHTYRANLSHAAITRRPVERHALELDLP